MIGFDLDGVLAEFCYPFSEVAKLVGAYDGEPFYTPDQATWSYDFDSRPVWRSIRQRYNWWLTLPPMADVDAAVIRQIDQLCRYQKAVFITSRPDTLGYTSRGQALAWLVSIGITEADNVPVVVASDKGDAVRRLAHRGHRLTAFLDDKPTNLDSIKAAGVVAVCRRWRYNADWRGPGVDSVGDFLNEYAP